MKNNKMSWHLSLGLVIIGIVFGISEFIELPDIIHGFCLGVGIALELIGLYTTNHDIAKIKNFKKGLFRKLLRQA